MIMTLDSYTKLFSQEESVDETKIGDVKATVNHVDKYSLMVYLPASFVYI